MHYTRTGEDPMGKAHTSAVRELGPDGTLQVEEKRKRTVSTDYAWEGHEPRPLGMLSSHWGKAQSVQVFTSPAC